MAVKIAALMVVVNMEDWVWWALKSVYPSVDYIIITEGVARDKWEDFSLFTEEGLSSDNTPDEIRRFIEEEDTENKVLWERVGFQKSISYLRDLNLQRCPQDTNYCLVLDADHIYDYEQIDRMRSLCEEFPGIRAIYMDQLLFFWDMGHVLEIGEEFLKPYGHHLSNFFYKWIPELRYNRDATFVDNQLLPAEWTHPKSEVRPDELKTLSYDVAVYPPQFRCYHMGWVGKEKTIEAHLLKTIWSRTLRMKWLLKNDPGKITEGARQTWMPFVNASREDILGYQKMYHKIWTGVFDDSVRERLVQYKWPSHLEALLREHPFWGKSKEWFGFEETI